MTTTTIDIVTACARYLAAQPPITLGVGEYFGSGSWIFADQLYVSPRGSGKSAIVVSDRGGFTSPNRHNTQQHKRLHCEAYNEVKAALHATMESLDYLLHSPQGGAQDWSDLRIISSHRFTEPQYDEVEGDDLWRSWSQYAVVVG